MSAIGQTNNNGIIRKNSAPSDPQEEWRLGYVRRMVSIRTGYHNGETPDRYSPVTRVVLQVNDVSQRLSQSTGALPDFPGKSSNS